MRSAARDLQDSALAGFEGKVPLILSGTTPDMVNIAPKVPTASLTCRPGTGASRVHFLWYQIAPGILGRDNTVDYLSLLAPRYGADEGDCAKDDKALSSWSNERLELGTCHLLPDGALRWLTMAGLDLRRWPHAGPRDP